MFTHRSTEANLFNGINLLSHHIVNNTFSQLGEDHSQKVPFLTMWLLMKSREGFPVTGLEGSPTVHPQKKEASLFSFSSTACPLGKTPETHKEVFHRKIWGPPPMLKAWGKAWHTTPVFLPGKSQGQRRLVGYSLQGHKELDTTEHAGMHTQSG